MKTQKSIQQLLQSRISLRRNAIRETEAEVVAYRQIISLVGTMGLPQLKETLRDRRQLVKGMAADQRLDITLYKRLLDDARWERQWHDGWQALNGVL